MRPGLVIAGGALLALGGLVVAGAFSYPGASSHETSQVVSIDLPAGGHTAIYLWSDNASYGSVALSWRSGVPTNVTLASTAGCGTDPGACSAGSTIVRWTANLSGAWSTGADAGSRWVLIFSDGGVRAASIQVAETSAVAAPAAVPMWVEAVQVAAAGTLGTVGAIALFLGLFLRSGVYRRPPGPGNVEPRVGGH